MMNPRSIHFRLVLWYGGLTLAVAIMFGSFIYESVREKIYDEVGSILTLRAKNIADNIVPHVRDEKPAKIGERIEQVFYPEAGNRFIRVLYPDRSILYVSGMPQNGHFDPRTVPVLQGEIPPRRLILVSKNVPIYIVAVPVTVDGKEYIVENGGETDIMEATLDSLVSTLLYALPLLVMILSVGGFLLVRQSLKPVDDIRSTASLITFGNLSSRLPVPRTGDSLEHLSVTLNQMLTRLEDAYGQASRFAADAAHELRTPLAIMRAELEAMANDRKLSPSYRDMAGSLLEESDRLTRITESLLALSRLDAGEAKGLDEQFDLSALARETAEHMALLADEKNISLDILADQPAPVRGDPERMKEVVVNLLDNAIKYTPSGGRVALKVFSSDGEAVLQVNDNGIGIPEESLPHVFERFYRVDKARSREMGGTGLGLSIAQSICEAHGGSIEIDSAEGQGTRCKVALPLAAG